MRNRFEAFAAASVLGAALVSGAAHAGPPFRTDDPEPVDYQHWEIYAFSTATTVQGDTGGVLFGTEVNYGAAPDLQLHMVVPLAFDDPSGGPFVTGIGDIELGTKYRFIQEDEGGWRPMVGVFPMVEISAGNVRQGLGEGFTRVYLPLWIQKSIGRWDTYGGGGYWINPGMGNKDYWFLGWLVQYHVTDQLTLGGEVFHQTADLVGGLESTGTNLGGMFDFTEHHHLLFSAGTGIQNAANSNKFSYYLGYQYTF